MSQPYVGEIRMFAGNFAPAGWMFCDGQTLAISENETLFNLIGTTYGGDGESTFNLPNLQSRVPIHMGQGPQITQNYQLAETTGVETVTLTTQQTPIHTHPMFGSTNVSQDSNPTNKVVAQTSGGTLLYIQDTTDSNMNNQAITPVGGSQPHENTQPFLVIHFIISLFGIFPSPS